MKLNGTSRLSPAGYHPHAMPAKRLKGDGNLADEIIDVLFEGKQPGDMIKIAK